MYFTISRRSTFLSIPYYSEIHSVFQVAKKFSVPNFPAILFLTICIYTVFLLSKIDFSIQLANNILCWTQNLHKNINLFLKPPNLHHGMACGSFSYSIIHKTGCIFHHISCEILLTGGAYYLDCELLKRNFIHICNKLWIPRLLTNHGHSKTFPLTR